MASCGAAPQAHSLPSFPTPPAPAPVPCLRSAVSVLWSLVVVAAVTPAIALAILPLGWAYARVQARYIATSR